MLASFLGVLPILTPSLCALAFIMNSNVLDISLYPRKHSVVATFKRKEIE
jgi:hypothetical protein